MLYLFSVGVAMVYFFRLRAAGEFEGPGGGFAAIGMHVIAKCSALLLIVVSFFLPVWVNQYTCPLACGAAAFAAAFYLFENNRIK
ncbi:MAG: hypothetical protein K2W95_34690 [Candidatus Obscuribacterales bacterium]|nr:hypothetical protein [Candidatus Obscuribacterales bacterium]